MTRFDRQMFNSFVSTKRAVGRAIHKSDRLHNLIESYWNVVDYQDITQHELMLADGPRVDSYFRGITDHITSDMTVIDLGTGTGILAAFAARQNPRRIYALDHCDIITTAQRVAEANGVDDTIIFLNQKSTAFTPPEPVDVILHEQIGNAVFNEQMFANMIDLRKRALKSGGRVLPNPITMFLEPAQLKEDYRIPFLWEQDLHGIDYSSLIDMSEGRQLQQLVPLYAHHYQRLLSEPQPLFVADFETIDFPDIPRVLSNTRVVSESGTLDGLCLYFEAEFDAENILSNSPASALTSWQTPMLRVDSRHVVAGDTITTELHVSDFGNPDKWTWTVKINGH